MATQVRYLCLLLALCCGCNTTTKRQIVERDPPHPADHSVVQDAAVRGEKRAADSDVTSHNIQTVSLEEPSRDDATVAPVPSTTDLSLANSIAIALSQNPDLIAARQADNVGYAALGVAQTYPFNPFIQLQATPFQSNPAGGPGSVAHYVLLMQQIQLAHQQQYREEIGVASLNSTRWNIHQAELVNVAQTERLYFNALYLRGLLELAQASHENNQQLLRTLQKQLDAGQANAADVAMVKVDARSTHQQFRLARANYETAIRDLKRQLGITADDPALVSGDLRKIAWRSPPDVPLEPASLEAGSGLKISTDGEKVLIASRVAARPDVMAAHSDVDVARANLCLATASKTPDLQIGPYYQRGQDGITFLGFRAHFDLPINNTGQPLEDQRAAEFNQRATIWRQTVRRAELEALAAWERYKLASEAVAEDTAYGDSDLPNELQRLEQQFVAGEVDIVRVMQARLSLIQNQRVRLDLLNEQAQAAANLTAASGISVEELLQ